MIKYGKYFNFFLNCLKDMEYLIRKNLLMNNKVNNNLNYKKNDMYFSFFMYLL